VYIKGRDLAKILGVSDTLIFRAKVFLVWTETAVNRKLQECAVNFPPGEPTLESFRIGKWKLVKTG